MIVSWNWLTDYIRLDMPVDALTERLALTGLNHESTTDVGGDIAIDLEVTSNRSDCLGHLGIAREISVLFDRPLHIPPAQPATTGAGVESRTAVAIEAPDLCPRFTARVVSGARVGESPWWMRKRLETLGVRPISNIVDVTNYVMFECGQPLHAYDLDRLTERRLIVRRAHAGETLTAINNRNYELSQEMLVIADAARPVGLAGVMGGLETEIGFDTTDILIEAAQFAPMTVRKTSRALGLFSPSSFRFERPLDPEITEWASRRCAELILEVAGGTLHPGVIDVGGPPPQRMPITLRLSQIERVLGIRIEADEVRRILTALGLEWLGQADHAITVRPPSWRSDLEREIDLIEEAARIHGYHHIPEDRAVPVTSAARGLRERVESQVRELLTGLGLNEAVTFSLVDESLGARSGPARHRRRCGSTIRAGSEKSPCGRAWSPACCRSGSTTRPTAIPMPSSSRSPTSTCPAPIVRSPTSPRGWPSSPVAISGASRGSSRACWIGCTSTSPWWRNRSISPSSPPAGPLSCSSARRIWAIWARLRKASSRRLELRAGCTAAELEFNVLMSQARLVAQYHALPPFPAVVRDLSLEVSRDIPWAELSTAVVASAGPTLAAVDYLDTFRGGNLPEEQQSVHFGMTFRHPDRTLTGDEVERAVKAVVEACRDRFKAKLRG